MRLWFKTLPNDTIVFVWTPRKLPRKLKKAITRWFGGARMSDKYRRQFARQCRYRVSKLPAVNR